MQRLRTSTVRTGNWWLFFIVLGIVASIFIATQLSGLTHANTIRTSPEGGTLTATAWVNASSPNAPEGDLCSSNTRKKPNFTAYLSRADISIGKPSSQLIFNLTVKWRDCERETRGYAIIGDYFCPPAGHYAGTRDDDDWMANDCVKHIRNVPDNEINGSLGCAVNGPAPADKGGNRGNRCTTREFRDIPIYRKNDHPVSGNPDRNGQVLNYTSTIPINTVTSDTKSSSNGTRSFGAGICQYWWFKGQTAEKDSQTECKRLTIYYSWTYSGPYNLVPTINSIPRYTTDPMKFQTRGRVAKAVGSGNVYGSHPWEVARLKFKTWPKDAAQNAIYTDSSNSPCTYATLAARAPGDMVTCDAAIKGGPTSPADTSNFSDEPDAALGEVICYMTSVRNPTPQKGGWRHSNMTCSMSGRQPSVQVWGGDLRVVGNASLPGGSLAISTSLTVITQTGVNGTYGSWGEYGVLTNGLIHNETRSGIATSGMASGAGLNKGSNSTLGNRNLLTFSNVNDSCAAIGATSPSYGCFGGVATNRPTTPQGASSACSSGNVNLTGRNDYVCDGIFTISSDLKYANSYSGISKLPRVRIFAKSFNISENVEQIDPWLITTGTESDEGWINTCSQIDRNNPGAKLSTEICGTQLRFNGPVYAGKIYLFRTAGSTLDGASDEEKKNSMNKSAEVFNLRPDAHLSSFGSGSGTPVATTDYVSELPPRF